MTTILLAVIAAGVWVMAGESVVFAVVRLRTWNRERRRIREVAERVLAAEREAAESKTAIERGSY